MKDRRRWIDPALWTASWLLLGLVVLLSLVPESPIEMRDGVDKLAHGFAYAALTLSFLLAGVWRPVRGRGRYPMGAIWIVIAAVGIGVLIEIIQDIESYRSMDALDAVADAVGAAVGASLWMVIKVATRNSTYRSPSPSR
ncbi:MAG: VanZ family protein [Actinomycetota bacterium]|nr:VanZ family protein [Actinomycetota bacterium]